MKEVFDKDILAKAIIDSAKETFKVMHNPPMTNDPSIEEAEIIEYQGRLRVTGVDKFKAPCYIAAASYYENDQDKEKEKNACGTLVVCLKEDSAVRLLNGLGQKGFDEDDRETVLSECEKFFEQYSQKILSHLSSSGYKSLYSSAIIKNKNSIPQGVGFPYRQYSYVEVWFELWRDVCMAVTAVFDSSAKN